MDDLDLTWIDEAFAIDETDRDLQTPQLPASDSPRSSPAAERVDPPSGDTVLPLLRLSDWDRNKQYDSKNPICIHYDLQWKVCHREKTRAKEIDFGAVSDTVLAPSDLWADSFQNQIDTILNKDNSPAIRYSCEQTTVKVSIERTRGRGLIKKYKKMDVEWLQIDSHLESLAILFSQGKKITVSIEFICKEATNDTASTTAKGKNKRKSASENQRAQRAAEAGLWARVYEHRRCKAKNCKQGPHCMVDEKGNHISMLSRHLEAEVRYRRNNMKDGETEDDINVEIEVPPEIAKDVLACSRKRKAESASSGRPCKTHVSAHQDHHGAAGMAHPGDPGVCGDRLEKLEKYCTWGMTQVKSDRWREALEAANKFAMEHLIELNSALQHPETITSMMVKGGVKPGSALQFVSNIRRFQQETDSD